MSHYSDPFTDQSNAALPNMARAPAVQHPGPLTSNPPQFRVAPSLQGQAAPTQHGGTGPHSGQQPMVNGNSSDNNSWIPSAHQAISNALRSSGLATTNHGMARSNMPPSTNLNFGLSYRAPPNSPVEGFARHAAPRAAYNSGAASAP
ncbi:hypothetical protein ACHAPT_013314 [Fusarium lateritium]